MAKKKVSIRLNPFILDEIDRQAHMDLRTRSAVIEQILIKRLRKKRATMSDSLL